MFSNIQQQRMHIPEHKVFSSICTLEIEDGYWKLSFFAKENVSQICFEPLLIVDGRECSSGGDE